MNTYKHFCTVLCLTVVTFVSGGIVAEVGVVTRQGTDIVAVGPYYLVSIIEDPEPVGIWIQRSPLLSARKVLNKAGDANGDGYPSMAINPGNGVPIVTWGKNTGSAFDIVESHFENGAWTTPTIIVQAATISIDPEPSITVNRQTGAVHIVYVAGDAAPEIMHSEAPADLSSWTSPSPVSEIGKDALRPSAVIYQGTLTVAYEFHANGIGNTPRQITVATSNGIGGFTHDTLTTTHGSDPNRPQLHVGGGASMWIDWIDGTSDMAWSIWRPATGWDPAQIELFTDVEDRDFHARGRIKRLALQ